MTRLAMCDHRPNRLFDARTLVRLADLPRWRIVASLPGCAGEAAIDRHAAWRLAHRHAHPYPEVLLALDGVAVFSLGEAIWRCRPGLAVFFGPGEEHDNNYPPGCAPLRHLWCRIVYDHLFATLLRVMRGRGRVVEWTCQLSLKEAGVNVPHLWAEAGRATVPATRHLLLQAAVSGMIAGLIEEGYRAPRRAPDLLDQALDAICQHLEETGGREASLAAMARLAGYGKFHFWRAFKARTGMSLHTFVDQCRVRKTANWLGAGLPRKEIAARLGFSEPSAFSRWCRKHRGVIAQLR